MDASEGQCFLQKCLSSFDCCSPDCMQNVRFIFPACCLLPPCFTILHSSQSVQCLCVCASCVWLSLNPCECLCVCILCLNPCECLCVCILCLNPCECLCVCILCLVVFEPLWTCTLCFGFCLIMDNIIHLHANCACYVLRFEPWGTHFANLLLLVSMGTGKMNGSVKCCQMKVDVFIFRTKGRD